jgi:hypothetical protein
MACAIRAEHADAANALVGSAGPAIQDHNRPALRGGEVCELSAIGAVHKRVSTDALKLRSRDSIRDDNVSSARPRPIGHVLPVATEDRRSEFHVALFKCIVYRHVERTLGFQRKPDWTSYSAKVTAGYELAHLPDCIATHANSSQEPL